MNNTAEKLMTVDEFLVWGEMQEGKWELHDGVPVCMSPERIVYARVKYRVTRAFEDALAKVGSPCHFAVDGPGVRIHEHKSFQPDSIVFCDENLPDGAMEVQKPLIVVEVLSPSTASYDLRDKLQGYFSRPTIEHYLIIDADKKLVMHHRRGQGDEIITRLLTKGVVRLETPGIELTVEDVFVP